jgi:serine/threonine protein kinase
MDKYQTYSTKTDCWSLGILAFELINGKLDEDHFGRSVIHVDSLSFQRNVSKEYKNLIFSLLSEDELDRPSISEVLALPIFRNK